MVRKINKALLSGDAWGEWYMCLFQSVALIFCCFMIVMSLAGILETNTNTIQNNIWFLFQKKRNDMAICNNIMFLYIFFTYDGHYCR